MRLLLGPAHLLEAHVLGVGLPAGRHQDVVSGLDHLLAVIGACVQRDGAVCVLHDPLGLRLGVHVEPTQRVLLTRMRPDLEQ